MPSIPDPVIAGLQIAYGNRSRSHTYHLTDAQVDIVLRALAQGGYGRYGVDNHYKEMARVFFAGAGRPIMPWAELADPGVNTTPTKAIDAPQPAPGPVPGFTAGEDLARERPKATRDYIDHEARVQRLVLEEIAVTVEGLMGKDTTERVRQAIEPFNKMQPVRTAIQGLKAQATVIDYESGDLNALAERYKVVADQLQECFRAPKSQASAEAEPAPYPFNAGTSHTDLVDLAHRVLTGMADLVYKAADAISYHK